MEDQPVTKKELLEALGAFKAEIKSDFNESLAATEARLDAKLNESLAATEARLHDDMRETVRDAQAEVLKAFPSYQEGANVRMRALETKLSNWIPGSPRGWRSWSGGSGRSRLSC
ncbi:MAG TPA: hypothetical protein VGH38_25475 [Bryobacteraceae bacterium]